jgi:hypothetical protein
VNTAFLQVLAIHVFATIWITIGLQLNGWVEVQIKAGDILTKELGFLDHNAVIQVYVDAIYFVTTTMTTVGYGDYSGTIANVDGNAIAQPFVGFLQFVGILCFSYISNRVV